MSREVERQGHSFRETRSGDKHLWTWCLERGLTLSAEYLPGVLNINADRESSHQANGY